jgi:hypothetical protein
MFRYYGFNISANFHSQCTALVDFTVCTSVLDQQRSVLLLFSIGTRELLRRPMLRRRKQ